MKRILFVLAFATFVLALIETGYAVIRLVAPTSSLRKIVRLDQPKGVDATNLLESDPELLWKCKNQPVAISQLRPDRRMLFLGDSITSGLGVQFEKSFPVLVGDALNADIVVDACPGYSTYQGKILLARDLPLYNPDIVVIWYGINDGAWWDGKADADHAEMLSRWKSYSLRLLGNLLQPARASATNDIRRVPVEDYAKNLAEMAALCRSRSADPVVVAGSGRDGAAIAYAEAAASTAAMVIDLRDVLNDHEMMLDGVHPNARGHTRIAGILEKRLGAANAQAPAQSSPTATFPTRHPIDVNCSAWEASCGKKP